MGPFARTVLLVLRVAFGNLVANGWKTVIVSGIIGSGAFLLVVGSSLLGGVSDAMKRSIVGSVTGHIQVYSAESQGELDLLGGGDGEAAEIAPLPDFAKVREALLAVPNVRAVVPMGFGTAMALTNGAMDTALQALRHSAGERPGSAPLESYVRERDRVRRLLEALHSDFADQRRVTADPALEEGWSALERASSPAFWNDFERAPLDALEFLENQVAPLAGDEDRFLLKYVGTDSALFSASFDRMTIVEGAPIPPGQRGLLFSKYQYERQAKLPLARGLDELAAALSEKGATIAGRPELQRLVERTASRVRELLVQLDEPVARALAQELRRFLGSEEAEPEKLLASLLRTTDENFRERYRFFYDRIAPHVALYRFRVGDSIVLRGMTREGYVRSLEVKVYGTYAFKGLENSPQAGLVNLLDLVSFRELTGLAESDLGDEANTLRKTAGVEHLSAAEIEATLFAGAGGEEAHAPAAAEPSRAEDDLAALRGTRARHLAGRATYDPEAASRGPILNAAVFVQDEARIPGTLEAIREAGRAARLPLKAASWQEASGLLGQFASLVRMILIAAAAVASLLALVVVSNALVMAALERVREIGTLRAIGAQRRLVWFMLALESAVLGLVSGAAGAALGAVTVGVLGKTGIAATNDVLTFFFSGRRLHPSLSGQSVGFAMSAVVLVSVVAGMYPALLAMRVSPREAMHAEE